MKIAKLSLALVALTVFLGASYQWLSEQRDRKLIPGELVAVDDNVFHMYCEGQGSPVVLVENGLTSAYLDWYDIIEEVGKTTKICAYDRLGLGWSSANDRPTRSQDVTEHLHKLLPASNIEGQILLVGFSAGGAYARDYYQRYPEQIYGMILVDSSHEQQATRMEFVPSDLGMIKLCNALSWTGLTRALGLIDSFIDPSLEEAQWQEESRTYNRTGFCEGMIYQNQGREQDMLEDRPPANMGALPLTVIAAGKTLKEQMPNSDFPASFYDEHARVWPVLQKELAQLSTHSRFVLAEGSGHAVHIEKPQIVINEILRMLAEVPTS